MYPSHDRITFFLVLTMAVLSGILSTWLLTGPSNRDSLGRHIQGFKFMLSSQGHQQLNRVD